MVPKNCGEKRKKLPAVGHLTAAVVYINENAAAKIHDFDLKCRRIWKERDTTMCMKMQHVGRWIEILSEFGGEDDDNPNGNNIMPKMSVWCKDTITEVYKDSESAWVHWDANQSVGYPETRAEAEFPSYDYNKGNEIGSWRFVVEVDYGL